MVFAFAAVFCCLSCIQFLGEGYFMLLLCGKCSLPFRRWEVLVIKYVLNLPQGLTDAVCPCETPAVLDGVKIRKSEQLETPFVLVFLTQVVWGTDDNGALEGCEMILCSGAPNPTLRPRFFTSWIPRGTPAMQSFCT